MPAIFVPRRKPVQQVFDGAEPDVLEVGDSAAELYLSIVAVF